ncbi:unnamed protein product [Linum tenue]|uniref:Uncharacterized protein n=1 Tax=Linum tenue TaxID=586396 RepID=A0AAV0IP45_9ROSI|nr:unnamed protein product [Linum tenue]
MSDVPPSVQGPQPQVLVAPAVVNGNGGGEAVVVAAQPHNGEAAPNPQPPNAPLIIDEEVIDRAKLKSLVWKHFKKIKVNNLWKAKLAILMQEYPLSMVDHLYFKRFIYVPAPHSSDRLASVLVNCMLDWNIDSKSEEWCWRSVATKDWSWVAVAALLKDDTAGEEGSNELHKIVAAEG